MAISRLSAQAETKRWMMIGIAGFTLALGIVFLSIIRGPGPAATPQAQDNAPKAAIDPAVVKFITEIRTAGQRPPRMSEPRTSLLIRQATDRTKLAEISNPLRIKSACMTAEALLALYRRPKGASDKPIPNLTAPNGALGVIDPYFLDEVGVLAGFIVRCLGAQIVAMERVVEVAGNNPLDAPNRNEARELKLAAIATMENLFASHIPDAFAPDYRTFSQFSDAVIDYSVVFSRALGRPEREKLLEKAAKYVEKTPPFMRENAIRIGRTLTSTECNRMCKLPSK